MERAVLRLCSNPNSLARFSHSLTYLKSCTQFSLYLRFSLLVIEESALLTNWQSAKAEVDYRFP